ncbi:hypothetical protein O1611_g5258 [Lasiodiplodia mahajangana]|uniref:Uncharacterized protein n=1 Tax=Lasiodiplodia mahajangana TaxID=1108764 RepID=A0ACC2JLI8_9PEZI|nr:hypothetical protein O1611_g5258 [Lasiodiplodia mahajangana]
MAELDPALYTMVWIAPLQTVADAAFHMMENKHNGRFKASQGEYCEFLAGDTLGHNVVIATLPPGKEYDADSDTHLASLAEQYFPKLQFGLFVGVATGLPNLHARPPRDIRLGDILVADPGTGTASLLAYEFSVGTANDGFRPPRVIQYLDQPEMVNGSASVGIGVPGRENFLQYYEEMRYKGTFWDPGQKNDKLHETGDDGIERVVTRRLRGDSERSRVWFGPIGSGKKLPEDARKRDQLRDNFNIIGLEIKKAGPMLRIPFGVVRGVCDYGDMHTNKRWLPYAAAMASAYAKAILHEWLLQERCERVTVFGNEGVTMVRNKGIIKVRDDGFTAVGDGGIMKVKDGDVTIVKDGGIMED